MKLPQWLEGKRRKHELGLQSHDSGVTTGFNACAELLLPEIEALRRALELERTCECNQARDPDCNACNVLGRFKEKFP